MSLNEIHSWSQNIQPLWDSVRSLVRKSPNSVLNDATERLSAYKYELTMMIEVLESEKIRIAKPEGTETAKPRLSGVYHPMQ